MSICLFYFIFRVFISLAVCLLPYLLTLTLPCKALCNSFYILTYLNAKYTEVWDIEYKWILVKIAYLLRNHLKSFVVEEEE